MRPVLIVCDGTPATVAATRVLAAGARRDSPPNLHLVNVQPALGAYIGHLLGGRTIRDWQRENGCKALSGVRTVLDAAGLPYCIHLRVGEEASSIAELADEIGAGEIIMSGEGGGLIDRLARRLLLARVIRRAQVPVTVVKWPTPAYARGWRFGRWRST
jgi:nucleotide-binding universal stress UspA family protein